MVKSGGNNRTIPIGKTQVNFNLENDILEKVKDIAYKEVVSNSEIYSIATKQFVEDYEKRNGKIKPRPVKGKGLKKL